MHFLQFRIQSFVKPNFFLGESIRVPKISRK